jgi:zinc transporter, ZIP family
MSAWFAAQNPIVQAFLAGCVTWLLTALGAAVVLFWKDVNRKALDGMLGFAAGVMIAASFWSLLDPAIAMAEASGTPGWIPAVTGFLLGGAFLWSLDKTLPHLHLGLPIEQAEGIKTSWRGTILLVLAMTLHNIPEGLAVGVAFGAAGAGAAATTLAGAMALTLGIGIQDFPEGTAVAAPLRREGLSRGRSFWYGQLSGAVEPIAAVVGAAAVMLVQPLLPYALAFAAGAMVYVVVEEVIPESQHGQNTHIATIGAMLGFAVMMLLDVALK